MLRELQTECWESTKRRGFFLDENIPSACRNTHQMTALLIAAEQVGNLARGMRKNHSVPATPPNGNGMIGDALLMSQVCRMFEEVGELAKALRANIRDEATVEAADVAVTLNNVCTVLAVRLEDITRAKLAADQRRGLLHGEVVR